MSSRAKPVSELASRYALAFFDLCKAEKALEIAEKELSDFANVMQNDDGLKKFLISPEYSAKTQLGALQKVLLRTGFHRLTSQFLQVIARNGRLDKLLDIIAAFKQLLLQERDIIIADIVSAHVLKDKHKQDLSAMLSKHSGKSVELNTIIDPSLLGGLTIQICSAMVDASLKTKLNSLQRQLREAH